MELVIVDDKGKQHVVIGEFDDGFDLTKPETAAMVIEHIRIVQREIAGRM